LQYYFILKTKAKMFYPVFCILKSKILIFCEKIILAALRAAWLRYKI